MNPSQIQDDVLGLLEYDVSLAWYEGKLRVGNKEIWLYLDPGEEEVQLVLDRARQIVTHLEEYDSATREFAATELLELKNNRWLDEEEVPLTSQAFKGLMALESLVVYPDGEVNFGYDDGELFWGHQIDVALDAADHFVDAGISG